MESHTHQSWMLGALPSRIAVILHLEPPKTTPAEGLVWGCLLPALSSSISHRVFLEGWTKQGGITLTKTSVDPWRRFSGSLRKGLERNCFLVASSKKNKLTLHGLSKMCCWLATWNKKKFDSERLGCLILVPKSSGPSAWSFDESTWFPLVKAPGGIPKRYFIQKIPWNSSGSLNHS